MTYKNDKKFLNSIGISLVITLLFYSLLLILYLADRISAFLFLGALLVFAMIATAVFIFNLKKSRTKKLALFVILLTMVCFVYEAKLIQYESAFFLVDSYREPEELIPNSNLYLLSVSNDVIQFNIQEDDFNLVLPNGEEIEPYEIEEITNKNRYINKTNDILHFLRIKKSLFEQMGANVIAFTGHEPIFLKQIMERDNLEGDSAGLLLALYDAIESGKLENKIPIGVTGAISKDGTVHEVGGIRSKTMISAENNFPYMIVPEANMKEAEQVKKEKSLSIQLFSVQHVEEAIDLIINLNES